MLSVIRPYNLEFFFDGILRIRRYVVSYMTVKYGYYTSICLDRLRITTKILRIFQMLARFDLETSIIAQAQSVRVWTSCPSLIPVLKFVRMESCLDKY